MAKAKRSNKGKGKPNLIPRPEERAAASVKESWARIEEWLQKNLPETLDNLRDPVKKTDLKKLEKAIGQKLPPDVVESWTIHDGEGQAEDVPNLLFGMRLIPLVSGEYPTLWCWNKLAEFQKAWDARVHEVQDECRSFPADAIKRVMGSPGWIPLHETAGGNYLGVDLDPGPNGRIGQVITFGRDELTQYVLAPSWAHFLEDLADELEADNGIVTREVHRNDDEEWTEITFQLRGCNSYFANAYEAWSKAKLPKTFQAAKRVDRRRPEDDATDSATDVAAQCVEVIRGFFAAMRKYEDTFLEIYPLSQFGVTNVQDSGPNRSRGFGMNLDHQVGGPKTPEQKIMWSEESTDEQKDELLFGKSPRRKALTARNKIWRRFLTDGEQMYADCFILRTPPEYDPAKVVPTAVRTIRKDHIIVDLAPFIGNTDYEKTYRYHLKFVDGTWRIDYRERMDSPKKWTREPFG